MCHIYISHMLVQHHDSIQALQSEKTEFLGVGRKLFKNNLNVARLKRLIRLLCQHSPVPFLSFPIISAQLS